MASTTKAERKRVQHSSFFSWQPSPSVSSIDSSSDSNDYRRETNIEDFCSGGTQNDFRSTYLTGLRHTRIVMNSVSGKTKVIHPTAGLVSGKLFSPTPPSTASSSGASSRPQQSGGAAIKYRTDLQVAPIHFMMERLIGTHGFERVEEILTAREDDRDGTNRITQAEWHFFWMKPQNIRLLFQSSFPMRLLDQQIINHFPNYYEISKKDSMYKNIKLYIKKEEAMSANAGAADPSRSGGSKLTLPVAMNWEAAACFAASSSGSSSSSSVHRSAAVRERRRVDMFMFPDSVPVSYIIPNDMNLFIEEFKRHVGVTWIVKPTGGSQGRGIFLINRLQQVVKWMKEKKEAEDQVSRGLSLTYGSNHSQNLLGSFIVSKYISNPLLIGGKKFDLRMYVLVTSFKPVVAYLHENGFARFCATKYIRKCASDSDLGSHLTNVSLQKGEDDYNTAHGGKWLIRQIFLFIQARYGPYAAEGLMQKIKFLIFHSLNSVKDVMRSDKHCFELYGYDVLIDADLNPHLIEVNSSPSLSSTTSTDRLLKEEVLADVMQIVLPQGFLSKGEPGASSNLSTSHLGSHAPENCYGDHRLRSDLSMGLRTGFTLL